MSVKQAVAGAGLLDQPQVVAALITFFSVIIALIIRDVLFSLYLANKKRKDEEKDRQQQADQDHKALVRRYADPLRHAVVSLKWRLDEIVVKKKGKYLLADAANIPFYEYKKLSTLFRFAALLGWIRAIHIEQSYLDPREYEDSEDMRAIANLQAALADGQHLEKQILTELMRIWSVREIDVALITQISHAINGECSQYLASKNALSARDLSDELQFELSNRCASLIRSSCGKDIPVELVKATTAQASVIFGIKKAYIYRDWQTAIGDLMLERRDGDTRNYTVIGFGVFEDCYISAYQGADEKKMKRWFDRLQAVTYDLDVEQVGIFDSRREQIQKVFDCCVALERALDNRVEKRSGSGKMSTMHKFRFGF